ncbi:hypothetical protein BTA51_07110 [Hahella sp. CCB-MM4]|uniref:NAD(P)/FAD-dependent oxidoreductase n=1 Tax=Hahella sp. (strain CCB-MM4) TaxID=1926491 RepID=UPI000B9AD6BB|nr:FAD-dependent oxidoreductase [Hahella sp. CCB-MM4]OZG74734.1 hypothetical protein BTA51_07110 [Hahella sp. CCB-MM4]
MADKDERKTKILVLGGGYGGMMAISRLRNCRKPIEITLVDAKSSFEQRIRLHEVMAGRNPASLRYEQVFSDKVKFIQARVVALQTPERRVEIATPDGDKVLDYDILIYALGSTMDEAAIPGVAEYVHCVNTYQQALEIAVEIVRAGRVTVIGGGLGALEISTELAEAYSQLQVSLVSRSVIADDYPEEARNYLYSRFQKLGIDLYEQQSIEEVSEERCRLGNNEWLEHDLCLWAGGFSVSPVAGQSGLEVDEIGRVVTDPFLRSVSSEAVYAVGDSARVVGADDQPHRMGCVTAMPHGAYVGGAIKRQLLGKPVKPFRFRYVMRCLSLGRAAGLVQFTDSADRPNNFFLIRTGGRWLKEFICRLTFYSVKWELSTGWPIYTWLKGATSGGHDLAQVNTAGGIMMGRSDKVQSIGVEKA